ncbi:MAG TPA: RDD family protein [Candidatus Limnocylindrales bacterium]
MPFAPPGPAPGLSWGGIGVRFGALLIDAVLMVVMLVIATLLAEAAGVRRHADDSVTYSAAATAIYWIWVLFFVAYHPACWYAFGSSVGQRVLGLRVVRASDGRRIGLGAVVIRYIIFAVSTGTVLLGLIAAAMAHDDPFKRAWHDEAARSVVVRGM